jgi:hypothetical protein
MRFGATYHLLSGHKTQTSRIPAQKWYDWYRDANYNPKIVTAEGPNGEKQPIKLLACTIMKLGYVAEKKYWEEGYSTMEGFKEAWVTLHKQFDPDLDVCVLSFQVLRTGKENV